MLPEVISQYVSKEMCKIQALFIGTLKSELLYLLDELVSPVGSRTLTRDFLSSQKSLSLRFYFAFEQEKRKFGMIINFKKTHRFWDRDSSLFCVLSF